MPPHHTVSGPRERTISRRRLKSTRVRTRKRESAIRFRLHRQTQEHAHV